MFTFRVNLIQDKSYIKTPSGTYIGTSTLVGFAENTSLEKHFLNFIKGTDFSEEPGESFYEEREWRKIEDFNFEYDDISAIIIPVELIGRAIDLFANLSINSVSILTWEVIEKT